MKNNDLAMNKLKPKTKGLWRHRPWIILLPRSVSSQNVKYSFVTKKFGKKTKQKACVPTGLELDL